MPWIMASGLAESPALRFREQQAEADVIDDARQAPPLEWGAGCTVEVLVVNFDLRPIRQGRAA
jgi:hypothetical protein